MRSGSAFIPRHPSDSEGQPGNDETALLKQLPSNPTPEGVQAGHVVTPDGKRLRYARWPARREPCVGTVLLLQGRAEYIEKKYETVIDLVRLGYDVVCFDWRGQGGSDRLLSDPRRGYVDSFEHYIIDLETVLREVALPDCRPPYGILGHSTGSLVALLAAPVVGNQISRMVLSAPLLGFARLPVSLGMVKFLTGMLSLTGLGSTYLMGGPDLNARRQFARNVLTSDTKRFERNQLFSETYPELAIGGPTAAWLFAACRAMDTVSDPDFIGSIHVPSLLVAAGDDKVVSNEAIEKMGYAMRSGHAVTISGARHELLQERDHYRRQLLAAFTAFVPGTSDG